MGRSLFLKIFLWFGAALLTVVVGTFLVGELLRPEPFHQPMRLPMSAAVNGYAQLAAEIYERDGPAALAEYFDRVEREAHIRLFLFDPQLNELAGRTGPRGASDLAQHAFLSHATEFADNGPPGLMAQPVTSPKNAQYVLVAELPMIMRSPALWDHLLHLLAIIAVSGLFCYWLARYLTAPVTKLRAATQELARGNLSARVAPSFGNRRDELAALATDFDQMAEQIESLVNGQRRLLGDISHELRSPLARLNVALELARLRAGDEAATALQRIEREAETLNEMIGQLLALTRLENHTEAVEKSSFDLVQLVREIIDDADYEAKNRNRSVEFEGPDTCNILGNEQLLRRAIENVVRNAVQYTANETAVEVTLDCGGQAVITVRDHGPGVPAETLDKLFRPFYRVDEARDRNSGGTGLGLAIAERAVRLHGGTVEAANVATGGLVLTIILPVSAGKK
ncbi:MAG: HAMP domain-containing protein [Blastocatellia bacterium]|nr:HAMP domain-containing protein [Blastocatellia bacterium]